MAATYKTPGVYIEEISKFPPSVAPVATAIPAFIGYTEKAVYKGEDLKNKPTRISSLLEYELKFGRAQLETTLEVTIEETRQEGKRTGIGVAKVDLKDPSPFIMYYALQIYFANGGGPCWIVSVGAFSDTGLDANLLAGGLERLEKEDEPTLIVFPEAQGLANADHFDLIQKALAQCAKLKDRFVIADLQHSGKGLEFGSDLLQHVQTFRDAVGGSDLKYGAVYLPNLKTTLDYLYAEDGSGVKLLHTVTDETGSNPGDFNEKTVRDVELAKKEGALYAEVKRELGLFPVTLPPSGAMAGIYARVDELRGVWKAPANVLARSVSDLTFQVTEELQEDLNVDSTAGKSINAIRFFSGRGILVWGARTLDGNSNEWRYVPVRRFFNMVEESTKKATARFVFEPNDANTWVKVRAMIENFLRLQWRAGALQGSKPEQAFFVHVGLGETMTALDILEGRMIVEIGMAVVRPAEFIILRFMHKLPES
jgi:phage tail sheath protein FI